MAEAGGHEPGQLRYDPQFALLAGRTDRWIGAGEFANQLLIGLLFGRWRLSWEAEKLPAKREVAFFGTVGEESEVADADEGWGQAVEQETSNEFLGRKGHGFELVAVAAIPVSECDRSIFDFEDAVVGNGDAMCIAAEVVEDFLRPAERSLGVDDPVLAAELVDEVVESGLGLELSGLAREYQLVLGKGLLKKLDKFTAEHLGKGSDRKEEIPGGMDEATAAVGQDPRRDEAMEMEMGVESLVPGVQDGHESKLAPEIVLAEGLEGLSDGFKQAVE